MKTKTETKSESTCTISISGEDLIKLLEQTGNLAKGYKSFKVFVQVPGGGDWSNTNLDLNQDSDITVQFTY